MALFSDIPVRYAGDEIIPSWFNSLRQAGINAFEEAKLSVVDVTNDYAIDVLDKVLLIDASSNTVDATLPTLVGNKGLELYAYATDIANTNRLVGQIEGVANYTFGKANEVVHLVADDTEWKILSKSKFSTSIEDNDDVTVTGLADGQALVSSGGVWVNQDLATQGELDVHIADTTTHGTTGDIVGTLDVQTLTNKTIDADLNPISNLAHGSEVDNPTSGVHGAVGDIVGTTDTQTLTNKTIDGNNNTLTVLAASQLSGATPIANGGSGQITQQAAIDALTNVSAATTAQVLTKDGSGNATFQDATGGGGSGVGALNYFANYDFEDDISGVTGDTNTIVTHDSLSEIIGTASLKISKGAINTSGQKVTFALDTIDNYFVDNAKMLTLSFYAENSDGNYLVKVYDNTNAAYLSGSPRLTAGSGVFTWDYQVVTTSSDYQVEFVYDDTNTSSQNLWIDNFYFGEQKPVVNGTPGWKQYDLVCTGTGWTTTRAVCFPYKTLDGTWRMSFNIRGTSSSLAAYTLTLTGVVFKNVTNYNQRVSITYGSSFDDQWCYTIPNTGQIQDNADGTVTVRTYTADVELESKPSFAVDYSNVVLSEATQNRRLTYAATSTGGDAIGASYTAIDYSNILTAETTQYGVWAANQYTADEDGLYDINASVYTDAETLTTAQFLIFRLLKNGTEVARDKKNGTGGNVTHLARIDTQVYLEKGDTLDFEAVSSIATNVNTALGGTRVYITKSDTGSQTIAPTEDVKAYCFLTTGSLSYNSTENVIYNATEKDTHNAYNTSTGVFTVPADGDYTVRARIEMAGSTWTEGNVLFFQVAKNGSFYKRLRYKDLENVTSSWTPEAFGSLTVANCVSGDTIEIEAYQNSSSAGSINYSTTQGRSYLEIERDK